MNDDSSSSNMEEVLFDLVPECYLIGWKAIARCVGVHPRTVKRWHYKICNLPYRKTAPSAQGRVIIPKYLLPMWLEYLGKNMPSLCHD